MAGSLRRRRGAVFWCRCALFLALVISASLWIASSRGLRVAYQQGPGNYCYYELGDGCVSFVDGNIFESNLYRWGSSEWRERNRWRWIVEWRSPSQVPARWKIYFNRFPEAVNPTRFAVPLWIPIAITTLVLGLLYGLDRRRRTKRGYCERCGYDLRASAERCPECGLQVRVESGTTSRVL